MASVRDYYDILGVKRSATDDEIRKAYRNLARKLHPDVNKASDAADKFNEVQEAYDVLSDAEKRKAYDQFGHTGVGAGGGAHTGAGPGGPWGGGFRAEQVDAADFASIFEQFMGPGRRGFDRQGARPRRPARPRKGADVHHTITVPFDVAVRGGTEELRLSESTGGSQTIEVRIPPAIDSGAKLRVKGKGQPGAGGQRGDLILSVRVAPHPYFTRDGLDVSLELSLTIVEATLGAKVTVPLLEGTAELTIPPGTSSGAKLRLKERGIRSGDRVGDFLAIVRIVSPSPSQLDAESREFLKRLGQRLQNPRDRAGWADKI